MADVLPKFSSRRVSSRRTIAGRSSPALGLRLLTLQQVLEPGENLEFEYSVHRVSAQLIERLEVSVLWYTEGKGSEDIGVHFFRSIPRSELSKSPLAESHRVETILPANPLSFDGRLFKIRWCIRLRLFLCDRSEITTERAFYLGHLTVEV